MRGEVVGEAVLRAQGYTCIGPLKNKPALCRGKPCEMTYPVAFAFE